MNKWDAELPAPTSENWRTAYGAVKGDGDQRLLYRPSKKLRYRLFTRV